MNCVEMSLAIRERARALRDADQGLTIGQLADAGELLVVLARIVEGKDVERAFGRPGDWGYSHPIGRALAAREDSEREAAKR
ncbi:hypothetical protein [Occallatibacter riparius]|uniref:Uncharacterized protein n=1 Tax=Occallatibacter riparius TaxID=1002689 RepID=A0A9J7BUM3_9BACT|nr:hypothetical protein [Occallatibacter riparius]UWZ84622.1 hypothetical protein MOP44_01505 [Occallatibacter riparius]